MIALVILNFAVLALVLRKVKVLEKDVQELNQTLIAITKTVRTVYLRKKTKG